MDNILGCMYNILNSKFNDLILLENYMNLNLSPLFSPMIKRLEIWSPKFL